MVTIVVGLACLTYYVHSRRLQINSEYTETVSHKGFYSLYPRASSYFKSFSTLLLQGVFSTRRPPLRTRQQLAMAKALAPMVRLGKCSRVCYFGKSIPEALNLVPQKGKEALLALEQLSSGQGVTLHPGSLNDSTRSLTVLPIAYKEAAPAELEKGLQSLMSARLPPVTLAVAVLGQCYFNGREGLLITQRANRSRNASAGTWNSLWVFPGGGVDAGEMLEDAAMREFHEETGLKLERSSLHMLATWQAAASMQHKQYLVILFAGRVEQDSEDQQFSSLHLQRDEVAAAAFLPLEHLELFCNFWTHALDSHKDESPSLDVLNSNYGHITFDGWVVDGNEQRLTQYNWMSLSGDGGRISGVGGAHRFGIRHYLRTAHLRASSDTERGLRAKL